MNTRDRTRAECDAGIEAFWAWWPEARVRIERAIATKEWGNLSDEISARVKAIHPRLAWEMGGDAKSPRTMLCVSPNGARDLRVLTERWLAKAPPADERWEFHPARIGRPGYEESTLEIAGYQLPLPEYRFVCEADPLTERLRIRAWHPQHPDMLESLQAEVILVVLDGVLGEDGVERWIGGVELTDEPLAADAVGLTGLLTHVAALREVATRERFCLLDGVGDDGLPMAAGINQALKRIDHLHAELHLQVDIPVRGPTDAGLPEREEFAALAALETELIETLGDDVAFLGNVTHAGRYTLHFFVPESSGVPGLVEAFCARHADREIAHALRADPLWTAQDEFVLAR